MKVCLINNLYGNDAVGGAEKVVKRRALEYQKNGDEVFVITTKDGENPQIEKSNEGGIVVYRVCIPNIFYYKNLNKHSIILKLVWHFFDLFNFFGWKIVGKILTEEKPDVIETHNLMGINFKGIRIKDREIKKYKWIHFLHDVQLVEPSGVLTWNHKKDSLAQKIYSWIIKRKFGSVDEVISPSEFLRDFYSKRGFFNDAKWVTDKKDTRNKIQINSKFKIQNSKFLYVGSLVEHKGVRILMRVWEKIGNDKELHIVGDGILREEVKKWASAKDNVKVYGRLEGEDLENVYKKCDTLIFPSICIENNPTVIHEAHEYGLRVIASDTGGVREIVNESDALVEPGDVAELVRLIGDRVIV